MYDYEIKIRSVFCNMIYKNVIDVIDEINDFILKYEISNKGKLVSIISLVWFA